MPVHRIRLKGPWEYEWLASADGSASPAQLATAGRVKLPADWRSLFGDCGGTVCFRRMFQKPTNLEPHERVAIALDGIGGSGRVCINGNLLGRFTAAEQSLNYDVTALLEKRNELSVEVSFDARDREISVGGIWGVAAIEIRNEEQAS